MPGGQSGTPNLSRDAIHIALDVFDVSRLRSPRHVLAIRRRSNGVRFEDIYEK